MTNVATSVVRDRFNTLIANRVNPYVAWGSNIYPANSDPGWFGGPAGGKTNVPTDAEMGSPGVPTAPAVRNAIWNHAWLYSYLKVVRIQIYMTGYGLYSDQTNWANTNYTGGGARPGDSIMPGQADISIPHLEAYLNAIWNNIYPGMAAPLLLVREICHSSCHDSCHNSRSRR